jgi:hypothetical protein
MLAFATEGAIQEFSIFILAALVVTHNRYTLLDSDRCNRAIIAPG